MKHCCSCFVLPVNSVLGDYDIVLGKWWIISVAHRHFNNLTCYAVAPYVTSQVDRCNGLLVGVPKYLLDCLQSVLNAGTRLLCNCRKYNQVTPPLHDVLHWLPVPLRIEYKVCLLVYKSLHGVWVLAWLLHQDTIICFGVTTLIDWQMWPSCELFVQQGILHC